MDRGQGMLYHLDAIQGDPVVDDKMIFYPKGVAEYLVPVPLGYISLWCAVEDVLKIALLVEDAVTDDEGCMLFVYQIVAEAKTALDEVIDFQRKAGIVGQEAPIIAVTQGLVPIEVRRRSKIIVGEIALLTAIDPAAAEIESVSFFYGAE